MIVEVSEEDERVIANTIERSQLAEDVEEEDDSDDNESNDNPLARSLKPDTASLKVDHYSDSLSENAVHDEKESDRDYTLEEEVLRLEETNQETHELMRMHLEVKLLVSCLIRGCIRTVLVT